MAEKIADKPPSSKEEILLDIKIKLAEQELKTSQANYQKTERELQTIEMNAAKIAKNQRDHARLLEGESLREKSKILACPHHKGGTDYAGWKSGEDSKFSVARYQWPNGDYSNKCTRCGNRVIPPVQPLRVAAADEVDFVILDWGKKTIGEGGYFLKSDKDGYAAAMKIYRVGVLEYNQWLQMPTGNETATSGQALQVAGAGNWKRHYLVGLHESLQIPIFQAQRWHKTEEGAEDAA